MKAETFIFFYHPSWPSLPNTFCKMCRAHTVNHTQQPWTTPPMASREALCVTAIRQSGVLSAAGVPARAAITFLSRTFSVPHWKTVCQCRGDKWGPNPLHRQGTFCSPACCWEPSQESFFRLLHSLGSIYWCSEALKSYSIAEHPPTSI